MRALLDTCVVIDVLQGREPFCKEGQQLFLAAANDLFAGCITAKAATDIYYLTHRHTHSDKASREVLSKLFVLFEVLDSAGIDCRRAIPSPVSDFEDAVMAETALRAGADQGAAFGIVSERIFAEGLARIKGLSRFLPKPFKRFI